MQEYDTLLKIEYHILGDFSSPPILAQYGTAQIPELKQAIAGKTLVIALDQASRKTGMCIIDFDTRELLAVLDLINSGFPTKNLYFESIYDFLYNHIADADIKNFVYEIPVEHSKNHQTLAVLESMRLFIRDFKVRMPSLNRVNMTEINIGTWRSHFLADSRYNGRRRSRADAKESAREECCRRYEELKYYMFARNDPPDSCDAVGIGYGALAEIYVPGTKGVRRVNRTMPIRNTKHNYKVVVLNPNDLGQYISVEFLQYYPKSFEVLKFNSDMSLEENVKRFCSNSNDLGVLLVPPSDTKTQQLLKWEVNQELQKDQCYFVMCWR